MDIESFDRVERLATISASKKVKVLYQRELEERASGLYDPYDYVDGSNGDDTYYDNNLADFKWEDKD